MGLAVFFFACEDEPDIDTPETKVLAGVHDSDMFYYEFNPPFQVDCQVDSGMVHGQDSIDLDADGQYDFILSQRFFSDENDSAQINDYNYPYSRVRMENSLEVARVTEVIYIGLGQTSDVFWIDTLSFEHRIDDIEEWSETNTSIEMWMVPPTEFWSSYGPWYGLTDSIQYMGIRMMSDSDYKYGWIKVQQSDRKELVILSYAFEE
ncbi:MAG TPA: hypothetical protein VJ946_14280 [Bacteroidales bacterium]|nr:hypothetical protein [Bacteroidales bacterium]